MQKAKPRLLIDIKRSKSTDLYEEKPKRVNLHFKKSTQLSLYLRPFATVLVLIFALTLGARALAPIVTTDTLAQTADNPIQEQQKLQEELEAYEREIQELEAKIVESKKAGNSLSGEITSLNAKISKINLQIKAVNLSISKLNHEVSQTKLEISETESYIEKNKEILASALANIYHNDSADTLLILLKSKELSEFFNSVNNLSVIQEEVQTVLGGLAVAREELIEEKTRLDLAKADEEKVKAYQDSQRALVQKVKTEKNTLLKLTKGQEAAYKGIQAEKQKLAAEIRNRIFRLLGGGELRFEEAVKIAKVAENATGVRAALILSVLTQESAIDGVIGANLGRCYYNTPRNNASGTVMSNSQKDNFLAILAALGPSYNPDTTPVSCPIVSDGAYGGAMGPSQFMPNTWVLYENRVAKITGGTPANPFNNLDAFTATALYLSDGLKGCKEIYTTLFSQENCAAAKYYAGGNWRNYTRAGRYGYRVAERAANLERDIETILLASTQ